MFDFKDYPSTGIIHIDIHNKQGNQISHFTNDMSDSKQTKKDTPQNQEIGFGKQSLCKKLFVNMKTQSTSTKMCFTSA